jgi:hypothetical protein
VQQFCYCVNNKCLSHDGELKKITAGLYKDHYEIHVTQEGIELPTSTPIIVSREIPWLELNRHDILRGTDVLIGFFTGERVYEVITDWSIADGHLVVVVPIIFKNRY